MARRVSSRTSRKSNLYGLLGSPAGSVRRTYRSSVHLSTNAVSRAATIYLYILLTAKPLARRVAARARAARRGRRNVESSSTSATADGPDAETLESRDADGRSYYQ